MKKIRVVQIGLAHDHAIMTLNSLLRLSEYFELAGIAVPISEQEKCQKLIQKHVIEKNIPYMSVENALNMSELDGAVIETEEINLTKYALMAAKKGLHIHMDKPGGLNLQEFSLLIQEMRGRNLVFSTGYMYRFNPYIQQAIDDVKQGQIGEVYCVEAQMSCEHPKEKRQWLAQFPGGMMFFLGCHLVDLVYRIQGQPLEVIPYNMPTGYEGVTGEDYGMALFKYPNGVSFIKTCAAECGGFARRQLVICGTKGTIEINPLEAYSPEGGMYAATRRAAAGDSVLNPSTAMKGERYNRYDGMMKNFACMVKGEIRNPYTYEYELELYKLILKSCGVVSE